MYYPKSQVQTDLYSDGDLLIASSGEVYIGFYWATSNGKFFTGRFPNELNNQTRLVKNISSPSERHFVPDQTHKQHFYNVTPKTISYMRLKNINTLTAPALPQPIPCLPTQKDYEVGEVTRYFCKKRNESLFIETNKENFQQFKEKDDSVFHKGYIAFTLPWVITGEQDQVALENKKAVEYREIKQGFSGLSTYLKQNYLYLYKSISSL